MIETLSLHHASSLANERRHAQAPRLPRVPRAGGLRLLLARLGRLAGTRSTQKTCEGRGC